MRKAKIGGTCEFLSKILESPSERGTDRHLSDPRYIPPTGQTGHARLGQTLLWTRPTSARLISALRMCKSSNETMIDGLNGGLLQNKLKDVPRSRCKSRKEHVLCFP